jgi:hypothetical protein
MSFIHYLFLGYFTHDGETVTFSKTPSDRVYKPVVRRPMDTKVIKAVLQQVKGSEVDDLAFPDDWMVWIDEGYLVGDKYTTNQEAINFIARLVERTRCDIYDVAAHHDISVHDWLAVVHDSSKP